MTTKVNGNAFAGDHVGKKFDYFTVRTTLDITATGNINDASQQRLNKLVEVIATRAQPILQGQIGVSTESAPVADLPVTGGMSGNVTVYTLRFAIEHHLAWPVDPSNPLVDSLGEALDGIAGFVYTTPTQDNNVSVTYNPYL